MSRALAVVTGANRGLGFEAAKGLALAGLDVAMVVRGAEAGKEAAAKLKEAAPDATFHVVDGFEARDNAAVADVANRVAALGNVAALINNAGLFVYPEDRKAHSPLELTKTQIAVNYTAPLLMTAGLSTVLAPGARVVNVTGGLAYPAMVFAKAKDGSAAAEIRERWKSARSPAEVATLVNEYTAIVEADPSGANAAKHGWPVQEHYGIAKLALMACSATAAANVPMFRDNGVTVNTMCPGFCKTDMTKGKGKFTPAQGADTMVWLATSADVAGVSGKHFSQRKAVDWRTARW